MPGRNMELVGLGTEGEWELEGMEAGGGGNRRE